MKYPRSITAVISFIIIILCSGCGKNALRLYSPLIGPDWYNSNINALPVSDDPHALSRLADMLSRRNALKGQKEYALRVAKLAYELDKTSPEVMVSLSRTAFIAGEEEADDDRTYKLAQLGIEVLCPEKKDCAMADPVAHYYYALHMGIIAREKGIFGIGKLPLIEKALKASLVKPDTDMGGPYRVLGMLYLKAPAWPKGIGDLDKALEMLEIASSRYPVFPQNHLFYAEALLEDEDYEAALEAVGKARSMNVMEIWGLYYYHAWGEEIEKLYNKIVKKMK